MSNRSYPADFSRPLREVPVANEAEIQAMLARLRRRCKIDGYDSVHDSSGELREPNLHQAQLPDGAKPSPPAVPNINAGANPAGASDGRVAPTLKQTPSAGGGCTNAAALSSASILSTRPAPIEEVMRNDPRSVGESQRLHECLQSGNRNENTGINASAENTLNGPGSGCEAELEQSPSLAPSVPALVWERISPYAMRTLCGTWTCCRVTIGGIHSYELWRRMAGMERSVPVPPSFPSFDQARQAAQDEMD